jgi:hypothetical protein
MIIFLLERPVVNQLFLVDQLLENGRFILFKRDIIDFLGIVPALKYISQGPSMYYVIKIWGFLTPQPPPIPFVITFSVERNQSQIKFEFKKKMYQYL